MSRCIRTYNPSGNPSSSRCVADAAEGSDLCERCLADYEASVERRRRAREDAAAAAVSLERRIAELERRLATRH